MKGEVIEEVIAVNPSGLPHEALVLRTGQRELGQGAYGVVRLGFLEKRQTEPNTIINTDADPQPVAVKKVAATTAKDQVSR